MPVDGGRTRRRHRRSRHYKQIGGPIDGGRSRHYKQIGGPVDGGMIDGGRRRRRTQRRSRSRR